MIKLASGVTMTCAVTDLIVGLVLIPMAIALSRMDARDEHEKKLWIRLMTVLSAVCITGFIVHGIVWSQKVYNIIWLALYAIMFMAVRQFFFIAVYRHSGKDGLSEKLKKIIDIVSLALYVLLCVLTLFSLKTIRVFVVYGMALGLPGFYLFHKLIRRENDRASKLIMVALVPQIVGAIYMLCRVPVFHFIVQMDHNCIYHLCLLVSVFIFYYGARRSLIEDEVHC